MQKKIYFDYQNRQFQMYVRPDGFGMAYISIYERRPNAKIYKWKYCDSMSFWIEDYDTVEEGCRAKLGKFLNEEAERLAVAKKWEEFYKKY